MYLIQDKDFFDRCDNNIISFTVHDRLFIVIDGVPIPEENCQYETVDSVIKIKHKDKMVITDNTFDFDFSNVYGKFRSLS